MLARLQHERALKILDKYTLALACDRMRLWDIPVKIRRGKWCRNFYIAAFRYARDSGKGCERFLEDYAFLCKELKSCTSYKQFKNLGDAYSTVVNHGKFMDSF